MSIYYKDDYVTIYCGYSQDIVPNLNEKVDLVLTDPPYGINGGTGGTSKKRGKGNYSGGLFEDTREGVIKNIIPIIKMCIDKYNRVIVTPGFRNMCFYPRPDSFGCFYQPAGLGIQHWGFCDSQPIFYYGRSPYAGKACYPCSFTVSEKPMTKQHPCSKPLSAWKKLLILGSNNTNDVILDPFGGAGTTAVAAKELGRKSIIIECNEKYCEVAAKILETTTVDMFLETKETSFEEQSLF